ncbi:MAG: hypothetical protein LEGION0398_MBIBDBAK_01338 [Legionellaceae bacterium]
MSQKGSQKWRHYRFKKIDSNGIYTKFPGLTIIASIMEKDFLFFQKIYNCFTQDLIKKYYSPLPFDSYHITTVNLYTEKSDGGNNWGDFIKGNESFFQRLHNYLS